LGTLTELEVPLLNERPYVEMTLGYLDAQNVPYEKRRDLSWFRIPGGAVYRSLSGPVPGDFSSAAFPAAAAAVSGGSVRLVGLDRDDCQGDKAFFRVLETMGCEIRWEQSAGSAVLCVERRNPLRGGEFDLNDTPDTLPACAVVAAFARGDTALVNAAHARIKETDRIAVMAAELGKLGVQVSERPDGLVIHGTGGIAKGGRIDSRGDHRVAMAFAAAARGAGGPIEIDGAESAAVTYPGFLELLDAETVRQAEES
jgi:3-phosphoshikimate 1-carboxyvinyltransferase